MLDDTREAVGCPLVDDGISVGTYETVINRVIAAFRGNRYAGSTQRFLLDMHRWTGWDGRCFWLHSDFLRTLLNDVDERRGYSVLPLTAQWCEGCATAAGTNGHADTNTGRPCAHAPVSHAMLLVLNHDPQAQWFSLYDPSQHGDVPSVGPPVRRCRSVSSSRGPRGSVNCGGTSGPSSQRSRHPAPSPGSDTSTSHDGSG